MNTNWQKSVTPTTLHNTANIEKTLAPNKTTDQELKSIAQESIRSTEKPSNIPFVSKIFSKIKIVSKKLENLAKKITTFMKKTFFSLRFSDKSKVNVDDNLQFGIKTNFEERSLKGKKNVYTRADNSSSVRTKTKEHFESLGQKNPNYKALGVACEFSDLKEIESENISFDQAYYAVKNFLRFSESSQKHPDETASTYAADQLLDILDEQNDANFKGNKITNLKDLKQALVSRYKEKNKTEESLDYELFKDIYRAKHGQGSAKDLVRSNGFEELKKACDDRFNLDLFEKFQNAENENEKYEALFSLFEISQKEVFDQSRFNVDKNSNITITEGTSTKANTLTREALLAKNNPDLSLEEKLGKLLLACANKGSTNNKSSIASLVQGMPKEIKENPNEILKFIADKIRSQIPILKKTAWEEDTEKTVKFQTIKDQEMAILDSLIDKLFEDEEARRVLSGFISSNENKPIESSSKPLSFEETDFSILDETKYAKFDDNFLVDLPVDQEIVEDQNIIEENMKKARFSLNDDLDTNTN